MNGSFTLINISSENGQWPIGDYKNQLTGKYERKFSISNISHIKFIIYIKNLPLLTFWVTFAIRKYEQQLACIKFQLNFW